MLVANSYPDLPENRVADPGDYYQNIVETVRVPLVVLASDLPVTGASRSLYQTFNVTPEADRQSTGANGFVQNPVDFNEFIEVAKHLGVYWLAIDRTVYQK